MMFGLAFLQYFDYDEITELIEGLQAHASRKAIELSSLYDQAEQDPELDRNQEYKDWVLGGIENDNFTLDESVRLSCQLAVVALYMKMELRIKRACRIAYREIKAEQLYKLHCLEKELKRRGIKIRNLPHISSFDELRCINNDIKHGGVVGKELAKYPGWKLGDNLSNIDTAYERIAPDCRSFIFELIRAMLDKNEENNVDGPV
jgi:hypothetical protein